MKDLTPSGIALRIAFLVAAVVTLLVFALEAFSGNQSALTLAVFPVSFIASYIGFKIAVERFIYKKVKVIYRTIHDLKLKKVDDSKAFSLTQIQTEVEDWDKLNKEEIDRLKGLENYRREFVGNLSHELKTPIFNIQGYLLTLLEGGLHDPKINVSYLEKASKSVDRMISLIEDLDDISKLESGVIELDFEKIDLVKLIKEVISSLEVKAQNCNVKLTFVDVPTKPIWVNVDADGINQVLVNLIVNSIKYGKENGETLVKLFDMDENMLIEVADNGQGIEKPHLARLFERFYRVDKSRARMSGGTGLGLSIVKHIIDAHHQTINVRSTPEVGSTFSFTLKKS
jgi:two-component system phosphate regulon sensor histidine kinase PhoR